jgi:hypothetical protein
MVIPIATTTATSEWHRAYTWTKYNKPSHAAESRDRESAFSQVMIGAPVNDAAKIPEFPRMLCRGFPELENFPGFSQDFPRKSDHPHTAPFPLFCRLPDFRKRCCISRLCCFGCRPRPDQVKHRNGSGERFHLRFHGYAIPLPPRPALSHLCSGTLVWHPGPVPRSGTRPSLVVSRPPVAPFVARAAAANVNPRTRLSHDRDPACSRGVIGAPANDAV